MASRDLTASFMERRSTANLRRRTEPEKGKGLPSFAINKRTAIGSDEHMLMEDGMMTAKPHARIPDSPSNVALPPQWVDDVDSIHTVLAEISRLMGALSSMHASRIGSVFGKDLDDMEGRIEAFTREITDKFRQAERLLQRVGVATKRAGGEEATVGANVQRSLAKKLQELSVEFRQKQRKYLADVQAQKGGGVADSDARFGIDLSSEANSDFGFTTQQLAVVDDLQEAVQSRDTEIAQIASSIDELGTIFKELAVLVIDQGTILDRIDYNMEAVVEHTKEGIQQLERAEKHQKSARPMKCIMCLLILIAVLLIILVLKHRRRGFF